MLLNKAQRYEFAFSNTEIKKANPFQNWLSNYAAALTKAGTKFTLICLPFMAFEVFLSLFLAVNTSRPHVKKPVFLRVRPQGLPAGLLNFCRSYRSSERLHGKVYLWSRRDSNPRADKRITLIQTSSMQK